MARKKKELNNEVESVAQSIAPVQERALPEPAKDERLVRRVERKVESNSPAATKLPNVRGGICDFCGILDSKYPSHLQYTLCPHYQGVDLQCTYCPVGTKTDVPGADGFIGGRIYSIFEYPIGSGSLTVVCDDVKCVGKHLARFQKANL